MQVQSCISANQRAYLIHASHLSLQKHKKKKKQQIFMEKLLLYSSWKHTDGSVMITCGR